MSGTIVLLVIYPARHGYMDSFFSNCPRSNEWCTIWYLLAGGVWWSYQIDQLSVRPSFLPYAALFSSSNVTDAPIAEPPLAANIDDDLHL